jgi:hypothetical protein
MQPVKLSKEARQLLRRRGSGEHIDVMPSNLEAYRELASAGMMEPVSGRLGNRESFFRLTEEGGRLANAEAAAEHLPHLSDQALGLLQTHLTAIGLRNGAASGKPTDRTRAAYRELARAGLMGACSSFAGGPESSYKLTEEAFERRAELLAIRRSRFTPSAVARRILRALSVIGRGVSATRSTTSA